MSILKDIPELVEAEVISSETADKIRDYYRQKGSQSTNRLFVVFGVLGAILIGLGIILIIAHNWDELSRGTKTFFAMFPLLIGQIFCGYTILKKEESMAWRESSASFLFFAVGACISLVSQIYNIPGNLGGYLLIWMLLCLPLIYLMNSSMVSLLYIVGITVYACETCYWSYPASESYNYWLLLLAILPYYSRLFKKEPDSNFLTFHHWLIPLSLVISLGIVAHQYEELMFIPYISLLSLYYMVGNHELFFGKRSRSNGYKIIGSLGTICILLILSFDEYWEKLRNDSYNLDEVIVSPEFFAAFIITLLAGLLFFNRQKERSLSDLKPIEPVFILFVIIFLIGMFSAISVVLINLIVFGIGLLTIRNGANENHLGILNFGLLIITALVMCRFFDTDISFVTRGILFVSVGVGFFATNYNMLKKRKSNG